jgi:methylglyoxal synthase
MRNIERAGPRARRTLPGRPRRILAETLRRRGLAIPGDSVPGQLVGGAAAEAVGTATGSAGTTADERPIIAVIAHDGRKGDLLAFAVMHRRALRGCRLIATATTGQMLRDELALDVETVLSGPMGGDAQIAGLVAEQCIDAVLFFVDPLSAHPHDPDIRTILRVCNVHDVPIATNPASAAIFVASTLFERSDEPRPELELEPERKPAPEPAHEPLVADSPTASSAA